MQVSKKSAERRILIEGITANSLHPGTVNTAFGNASKGFFKGLIKVGSRFLSSPQKGAKTSVFLASDPSVEGLSGDYYRNRKIVTPSKLARDESNADQLWEISMQLAKIDHYGQKEVL